MFSLHHKLNSSPDQDEEIEYKEFPRTVKKSKKTTIALAASIILLLVLCVIFIVLFAIERRKNQEHQPYPEIAQPKICASKKCLFTAVGKSQCVFKTSI